jgi:hypothetical protein
MSFAPRPAVVAPRHHRHVALCSSLVALVAGLACSAPSDEADGPPDFGGTPPGNTTPPPANGATNPTPTAPANANTTPTTNEPNQGNGTPVADAPANPSTPASGTNPPPAANMGAGGSSMVPPAPTGGGANMPTPPSTPTEPTLPTPPGEAFFFDDFEGSAVGQSPANWDFFVAWVANQNNPSGATSALVDDTRAASGTHSVHFAGGQNPAQITLPLPAGTSRLYVRAMVFMTRQLGQNPGANHETLIGIRGTPGQASNEIRFGEIKGVIGTNEVPTDNITPKQDQWGMGPAVAANQWHCVEVQFLGDEPQQNELFAYVDNQLVHSVTAPDQWNNGNLGGNWMAGKFSEVILGWHSFSGINTDVWMDDIVLSTAPIGCN